MPAASLPADALGKTADYGLSTWNPSTYVGERDPVGDAWIQPGVAPIYGYVTDEPVDGMCV